MSTYQRQQAFLNPEESATVLHAIMNQQYSTEWLAWDPVTIALEIQADFQTDPCSEAMDRICAMQTVMMSDAFFKRVDAFLGVVNTLNTGAPAFDAFDPSSVEEIAWAVAEVAFSRELLPFSYAVRQYVRKLLQDDGYDESNYPEVLKEIFERTPDTDAVRESARTLDQADANRDNVDEYVEGKMSDLIYEFNKISDLQGLDALIMARGMDEALKGRDPNAT